MAMKMMQEKKPDEDMNEPKKFTGFESMTLQTISLSLAGQITQHRLMQTYMDWTMPAKRRLLSCRLSREGSKTAGIDEVVIIR